MNPVKSNEDYTVVIFRGTMAPPLRFSIPRKVVRGILAVVIVFGVAELAFLTQYVIQTGAVWELRSLRQEQVSIRAQTSAFANSVDDLKRRLLNMREINQRLRVMMGIDAQKSEDLLDGKGGIDLPLPPPGSQNDQARPGAQSQGGDALDADSSNLLRKEDSARLDQALMGLDQAMEREEQSLQKLSKVANERVARLGAMPSIRPVQGWMTSGFGPRMSPFTGQMAMHDGMDIGAPMNSGVKATAAGRVSVVGYDPKMGNLVNIDHGYGIETQFGHLAKIMVRDGQKVKRGDLIALVGNTGFATGPHLHYMVKIQGRPVNPQTYILE
ncbi:MAG: M23 family metallopeptidase [Nitrospira sp.]|nr:MAG: M23 family metallopeptidase [Nitrospira sp.]